MLIYRSSWEGDVQCMKGLSVLVAVLLLGASHALAQYLKDKGALPAHQAVAQTSTIETSTDDIPLAGFVASINRTSPN